MFASPFTNLSFMITRLTKGFLIVLGLSFLIGSNSCKKDDMDEIITVTDVDGNVYNTLRLGAQLWIAENLRTTRYNDGVPIPHVTANTQWANLTTGAYSYYNNNPSAYRDVFGALYNWNAVNTGKLCPEGWHVPSDEEWAKLAEFLGGEGVAGGKLKESGTSYWKEPNTGAINNTQFSALPGGSRIFDGSFYNISQRGIWWSSTEYSANNSYTRLLDFEYKTLFRTTFEKRGGLSVRCIKN